MYHSVFKDYRLFTGRRGQAERAEIWHHFIWLFSHCSHCSTQLTPCTLTLQVTRGRFKAVSEGRDALHLCVITIDTGLLQIMSVFSNFEQVKLIKSNQNRLSFSFQCLKNVDLTKNNTTLLQIHTRSGQKVCCAFWWYQTEVGVRGWEKRDMS